MNVNGQSHIECLIIISALITVVIGIIVEHSLIIIILNGVATDISINPILVSPLIIVINFFVFTVFSQF